MILSETQARNLIQAPRNKVYIDSVKEQESTLRVFTEEMSLKELQDEWYWRRMLETMSKRIDKKFPRVSEFFRFPLPVVSITDSILNDFYKVFEGKNRFFAVNSPDDISELREWIYMNNPESWVE